MRELDLNQRPSGYEPDELPDCSIPHQQGAKLIKARDIWMRELLFFTKSEPTTFVVTLKAFPTLK